MTDVKWTAGPWRAGRPDMATVVDGVDSKWIYAGAQYVAVASGQIVSGSWDEVMANANLIAAAPTMADYVRRRAESGDAEAIEIWSHLNA